jgi:hypothetical protein
LSTTKSSLAGDIIMKIDRKRKFFIEFAMLVGKQLDHKKMPKIAKNYRYEEISYGPDEK